MSDGLTTRETRRPPVRAAVPRAGALTLRRVHGDAALSYYLYVPAGGVRARVPVLVSVHGISRNAREHARVFSALAEDHGLVIVSPVFAEDFYPDFQRLGIDSGRHPDTALDAMVADAGALAGVDVGQFALFGYSGGAQFAHRYALTSPERVAALAVASAGWYTWPTDERVFPYGLPAPAARPELRCRFERFLEIPLCVLVGALDTARDRTLRRSLWVDREQGGHRLERALRWFEVMQRAAASRGIERRAELRVLAGSDHDFMHGVERDAADRRVVEFFYGTAPCGVEAAVSSGVRL